MASQKLVDAVRTTATQITANPVEKLISNPKWGSINFESARSVLEGSIFALCEDLQVFPIEILPDPVLSQFAQHLQPISVTLDAIRDFSVESGEPRNQRNTLVSQLSSQEEQLLKVTHSWLPFLALKRGDVEENIQKLDKTIQSGKKKLEDLEEYVKNKHRKIEKIVTDTREAAGEAGVAHFTERFAKEAVIQRTLAEKWLVAATLSASLSFLIAALIFLGFISPDVSNTPENLQSYVLIQTISSKFILLGILITASLWCGRQYSIHKNVQSQNQHRADALKTFQAFTQAANETINRDAVLIEAARAIFSPTSTGHIRGDAADHDSSFKIFEVLKHVNGASTH